MVLCLHIDGSCDGTPEKAGIGGLLRRDDGQWVGAFAGHLGSTIILHAELEALLEGLRLAWDLGFRELHCFLDSLTAKHLVEPQVSSSHRYASLTCSIQALLLREWKCMRHINREGNQSVDLLAKLGRDSSERLTVWETSSVVVSLALVADYAGIRFRRGQKS